MGAPAVLFARFITVSNVHEARYEASDADACLAIARKDARKRFDSVLELLSEGLTSNTGRGRVYLHHDRVQRILEIRPTAERLVTRDVEIGGVEIPAGSLVWACYASTGRDEQRFPEASRGP